VSPGWLPDRKFVPVKAYTATDSSGEVHLNQLHRDCNSRSHNKKTCPIHGEVSNDQIVSGYEYAKGQYVTIEPAELDQLRTESDKAVNIDTFVSEDLPWFRGQRVSGSESQPFGYCAL
jgi:DNA end-binding protein Ku